MGDPLRFAFSVDYDLHCVSSHCLSRYPLKELTVLAMVYNLVRMVMWHSAILQHIAAERISFLDA